MAVRRVHLAEERNRLAERRNVLSQERTTLAGTRTDLATHRTTVAVTRTRLSLQRTELARERTSLALIRTGLAFFTLGVTFLRYFAVSKWTAFDVALILFSILTVFWGGKSYRRAAASEKLLQKLLAADRGLSRCPRPFGCLTAAGGPANRENPQKHILVVRTKKVCYKSSRRE